MFQTTDAKKRALTESNTVDDPTSSKKFRRCPSPDYLKRDEWALVLAVSEKGDKMLDTVSQKYVKFENGIRHLNLAVGQVGRAVFNGITTYFMCVKDDHTDDYKMKYYCQLATKIVKSDMVKRKLQQIAYPGYSNDNLLGHRRDNEIRGWLLAAETGITARKVRNARIEHKPVIRSKEAIERLLKPEGKEVTGTLTSIEKVHLGKEPRVARKKKPESEIPTMWQVVKTKEENRLRNAKNKRKRQIARKLYTGLVKYGKATAKQPSHPNDNNAATPMVLAECAEVTTEGQPSDKAEQKRLKAERKKIREKAKRQAKRLSCEETKVPSEINAYDEGTGERAALGLAQLNSSEAPLVSDTSAPTDTSVNAACSSLRLPSTERASTEVMKRRKVRHGHRNEDIKESQRMMDTKPTTSPK